MKKDTIQHKKDVIRYVSNVSKITCPSCFHCFKSEYLSKGTSTPYLKCTLVSMIVSVRSTCQNFVTKDDNTGKN